MSDDGGLFPAPPADPTAPQVVERGEGVRPYRARKPATAIVVHVNGYDEGILVLRCHDPEVATYALNAAIDEGRIARDFVERLTILLGCPTWPVWVRWVPEDPHVPDGPGVYERELRGTVGATPAVLIARPNHPSTTTKGDNHE